jgi:hypothetical protein
VLGACGGLCAAAGFHNLAGREGSGDSRKKAERAGEAWGKTGAGLGTWPSIDPCPSRDSVMERRICPNVY